MAKSFPGFVRIKERFPYAGKGPEAVALGINAAFKQFARPQKLTLEAENSILIEHLVPEEEGKKLTVTWHESIRTKPMDEYPALTSVAAMLTYSFAVDNMADAGFELCHVLIGNRNVFCKWLGIRLAKVNNLHVFGTPATVVTDIPSDVFILCGAQSRDADAAEVLYSIKVAIPLKELTKKILEAGLVDKHVTRMMQDWGYLEPGSTELVAKQKLTKERLEQFVEDMEVLLSPEVLVKETVLDEPKGDEVILVTPFGEISAIKESNGDFIINPFFTINPGNVIRELHKRHEDLEVQSVVSIYKDNVIFRKRVTATPAH